MKTDVVEIQYIVLPWTNGKMPYKVKIRSCNGRLYVPGSNYAYIIVPLVEQFKEFFKKEKKIKYKDHEIHKFTYVQEHDGEDLCLTDIIYRYLILIEDIIIKNNKISPFVKYSLSERVARSFAEFVRRSNKARDFAKTLWIVKVALRREFKKRRFSLFDKINLICQILELGDIDDLLAVLK